jgi:predicted permease
MPEDFRGLMVDAPDYWAPLSQLGQVRPIHAGREDRVGIDVIGRLRSGVSRTAAQAELAAWHMRSSSTTPAARPDTSLVLEPRTGTVSRPAEAMLVFTPLLFAFGLILLIGCANVANLLLARGVARRREIGVRLALGASRGRVIRQLLTESLLLAFLSAGLAFAVSRLTLHLSINAITATMPPDIGDIRLAAPPADWRVALFLVAGAIASTLVFALAPALHATRLELVGAMRGEVLRDARPGRARTALIALQVAASTWLLICSALFLQSARTAASADPGIRTADTLFVDIINEDKRAAMIDAVRREPSVVSVAASAPDALARPREAFAEGSAGRWPVAYRLASADYFDVLGIDVLRGRAFNAGERTADAAVAMVSDSVARLLWPDRDAVGQVMHLAPDLDSETQPRDETPLQPRSFVVVGVARDVAGFRMAGFKEAGIYLPTNADAAKTSLTVRVQGDPEIGRRTLLDRLTAVDPNMGQVLTFRTIAGLETYGLRVASSITFALGSLALVLTLSGLFSVLSFLVEQRAREIGVRMALGATRWQVCALVLRQVARPVGFGLAAGTGLAVTCGALLLATPAAARIQSIVDLFDPVAYTASLFVIVAACVGSALIPTLRAGRIDPAVTLRHD